MLSIQDIGMTSDKLLTTALIFCETLSASHSFYYRNFSYHRLLIDNTTPLQIDSNFINYHRRPSIRELNIIHHFDILRISVQAHTTNIESSHSFFRIALPIPESALWTHWCN